MPYAVRKKGSKWQTYNPVSGRVYGTHDSKEKAEAQKGALYANAPPEDEKKASYTWWPDKGNGEK